MDWICDYSVDGQAIMQFLSLRPNLKSLTGGRKEGQQTSSPPPLPPPPPSLPTKPNTYTKHMYLVTGERRTEDNAIEYIQE
jgi:hypothetical protein